MIKSTCPPIRLSTGTVVRDPLAEVLRYIGTGGSYRNYDAAPVAQDSSLSEADVRVGNRFTSRMSEAVIAGILAARPRIEAALGRLPASASLTEDVSMVPWDGFAGLVAAFDGVPAVGLARITKVMHPKRRAMVPILDSVVEAFLATVSPPPGSLSRADRAVALTRTYKGEMDRNREPLSCLRAALAAGGFDLTECRVFDMFAWSEGARLRAARHR